jgi:acyl-CoA synthetase (AMP-forming)/AMP-acid ligase II
VTGWNFADVWEVVAAARGDAEALVQGGRRITWSALERRAHGVAATLVAAGLGRQAKVAQYLHNCPEYLESIFAAFSAALVPVNTNYRYAADELVYLWDNADAEAVVFHGAFTPQVQAIRDRVPRVRCWLWVDDGTSECPAWATPYEDAAAAAPTPAPWPRSGEDLLLLYTGGTTGLPKGVMWRQADLFGLLNPTSAVRYDPDAGLDGVAAVQATTPEGTAKRLVPAPPLMHGTALFLAMAMLDNGGTVVLLPPGSYSAPLLLDTIDAERVTDIGIVGDAFARPLLGALDAEPDRWDLSSLTLVVSSGVMWSTEVKAGLLAHRDHLLLVDTLGSSEALGMASSRSSRKGVTCTAGFRLSERTRVITDDGADVHPGSGEMGLLAMRGPGPIGYYKDPAKSATTFRLIDGERWTVPGDFATVDTDGVITLLGRGSQCINTGGEKVFPEEVEEVLKQHPSVHDAVVVGVPHERFGEAVVALTEPATAGGIDEAALIDHVRARLAHYKAPRHVLAVDTIGRAPNGKVDYARLRGAAIERLGAS